MSSVKFSYQKKKKKKTVEERRKTHLLNTYYVTGTGDTEVKVTVVGGYRGCECQG